MSNQNPLLEDIHEIHRQYIERDKSILKKTLFAMGTVIFLTIGAITMDRNYDRGQYFVGGMIASLASISANALYRTRKLDREYNTLREGERRE